MEMWLNEERSASQVESREACFVRRRSQRRDDAERSTGDACVARRRESASSQVISCQRKVMLGGGQFSLRRRNSRRVWDTGGA